MSRTRTGRTRARTRALAALALFLLAATSASAASTSGGTTPTKPRQEPSSSYPGPGGTEPGTSFGVAGSRAKLRSDGTAVAPASAPARIKAVIAAANKIAHKPYRYGGGHGSWTDSGYDCSGSVSFALHGGHLLRSPEDSTGLMSYGARGPGRWITIYAHGSHAWMTIAGLRFDTSGARGTGSRWQRGARSAAGYRIRHPAGF